MRARSRAIALGLLAVSARAYAEKPPEQLDGTIVRIDKETAFFDVGEARARGVPGRLEGLHAGLTVDVLSTVSVKHPVTGEELSDHFPLGSLLVVQVGRVMSYGRIDKKLASVIKVGDVVRLRAAAPIAAPANIGVKPLTTPPGALDPVARDALTLAELWKRTLGATPADRVALLEGWLRVNPGSPWQAGVEREIVAFRTLDHALREASDAVASAATSLPKPPPELPHLEVRGALPTLLYEGDPLEIAVAIANPVEVTAAFAFARRSDQPRYERFALAPDGDGIFRVRIPATLVRAPGCSVFVEVTPRSGSRTRPFGDADHPSLVPVEEVPHAPHDDGPGHSAVRGFFEFVDFNRLHGNDYYLLAESDFMYRIGDVLWGVRTGFGVLSGRGGKVSELDPSSGNACDPKAANDPACGHEVGFNYGYVEAELHFSEFVGASLRLLGGHTVNGTGAGVEGRVRIGHEDRTNLVLGASFMQDIGALATIALEWDVIHGFPMSLSAVVTNQPAEEDIGVRIVYQLAYRARSWIQPALRIGYDVRTITHAGPSFGLGLVMGW